MITLPGIVLLRAGTGKSPRGCALRLQPALGHREHAELVDRAEAVLERADHAEATARIAFEIQHGIHHVLEHPGAGQRAFLGHVADQEHARCRFAWHSAPAARRIRAPAPREPGADCSSSVYTVWMESTTSTRGRSSAACARMRSSEVSASSRRRSQADARRRARRLTCCSGLLAGDVERRACGADRWPGPAAARSTCRCRGRRR